MKKNQGPTPTSVASHNNRQQAFSLIELLVVIAIIAVLAAILTPAISSVRTHVYISTTANNLRNLQTANQMYAQDNRGVYLTSKQPVFEDGRWKIDSNSHWVTYKPFTQFLDAPEPGWKSHEYLHAARTGDPDAARSTYGKSSIGLNTTGPNNTSHHGNAQSVHENAPTIHNVRNPSKAMAFADAVDYQVSSTRATLYISEEKGPYGKMAIAYRYKGKATVVYYDGSIGRVAMEDITPKDAHEDFWVAMQP
ncbi:prepilin-type N-terminal cleavage/methylation domain-containing protein [Coraliomargarita sp. SDUM461003]|uniref:Prepilin-type N-terminal cleavage/methylation domain-containing protein n=1 Tax=Thalassobacterium maritimum TaxID=3041265 RepID=A0ABU1ATM8_9BACT|nr:prepilin-type N-terminal cleavage/methylation domain-containing protein [Coraliomargarita sp. SDUM461003]MDQ8207521.1 prepilin-type N-terminal cleavage/methylation domain-containing protein [Coraliomargarita sp. SDUM461003]